MIKIGGHQISQIQLSGKDIKYVRVGKDLIWQSVLGCFGSGKWVSELPWINEEAWRNI